VGEFREHADWLVVQLS
jgi:uncharacterized membrane protein YoaK (UPF0700 family)